MEHCGFFLPIPRKENDLQTKKAILSPVVAQGTLKRKTWKDRTDKKKEDLKDEETEGCTEEGSSFVSDYHDSMKAANFQAYFADLCKRLTANSVNWITPGIIQETPSHIRIPNGENRSYWIGSMRRTSKYSLF